MPQLTVTMTTPAPAHRVWKLLTSADTFPTFMEDVSEVDIVTHPTGDTRISTWSVRLEGAILEWSQREHIDEANYRLTFEQIDGDLSELHGTWAVEQPEGGSTRVSLEVAFEIGIPLLADVLNPVALEALRDNFQRMLGHIDQQSQSAGSSFDGRDE